MANVLHRVTRQYLRSVNTPDFPTVDWIHNPDLSAVVGFHPKYWTISGDTVSLQTQQEQDETDFLEKVTAANTQFGEQEFFGKGTADVVINSNFTVDRDYYLNTLEIAEGVTLTSIDSFRIICRSGLIVRGTLLWQGHHAVGATPGVAGAYVGTLGPGSDGAAGGLLAGANGDASATRGFPALGDVGGTGGSASGGATAGGDGGAVPAIHYVYPARFDVMLEGSDTDVSAPQQRARFRGGTGGGAGAGDVVNLGGGGGQGGPYAVICAPYVLIAPTGQIICRGGNGGDAAGGNAGGGGGGGGGFLTGIFAELLNQAGGSGIQCIGGQGGLGSGTGAAGANGANGVVQAIKIR